MRIGGDGAGEREDRGRGEEVGQETLVRAVGGLPAASSHASHLAVDTLVAVLGKLGEKSWREGS